MLDPEHPANRGVLSYLDGPQRSRRRASQASGSSCSPEEVEDPYYRLGAHPDIVTRLWDDLGAGLPADCRWVVLGTPALVRPDSGVVLSFAAGTTYALRLAPAGRAAAVAAGAETVHRYPAYPQLGIEASVLDLGELGDEWVFGAWRAAEAVWCRQAFDHHRGRDSRGRGAGERQDDP